MCSVINLRRIGLILLAATVLGGAAPDAQSCKTIIDWNTSTPEAERTIWLAYLMHRVAHEPQITACRKEPAVVVPTFDQELDARETAIRIYLKLRERDAKMDVPYFNDMARVAAAGFTREYVWMYLRQKSWLEQPTGLRLTEFETWQKSNLKNHTAQTQGAVKVVADGS